MPAMMRKFVAFKFFNPNAHLASLKDSEPVFVGMVGGEANGIIVNRNKDDEVTEGLKGTFKAVRASDGMEMATGALYLPSMLQEPFHAPLRGEIDQETGEIVVHPAAKIRFVVKVYIEKDSNPRGYTWLVQPVEGGELQAEADVIADLRDKIAIAPPASEPEPAKAAPPRRGKVAA